MVIIKVLCVEDDEDDFNTLKHMMQSISRDTEDMYFVERAKSAALARAYSAVGEYDLFIVDYHLEGDATGGDFLKQIQEEHAGAPAILITGRESIDLDTGALEDISTGKIVFLKKRDLTQAILHQTIRAVLRRRMRLLVLDDDSEDFELARTLLQMSSSYRFQVDWANSLDQAMQRLDEYSYDGFLIDYHIGNASGIEFVQELKRRNVDKPMLLVTGHNDTELDEDARNVLQLQNLSLLSKHQINTENLVHSLEQAGNWKAS